MKQAIDNPAHRHYPLHGRPPGRRPTGGWPAAYLVAEAIEFYWGERCPDHEDGCPVCEAWGQYDNITGEIK